MKRSWIIVLSSLMLMLNFGCGRQAVVQDMSSADPSHDQWAIAALYSREAATMRQKAEDLSQQALKYEQLFGPDSDWVSGARLLARYYEERAQELERLSEEHAAVAEQSRRLRQERSKSMTR
jgi:hypothetical protein